MDLFGRSETPGRVGGGGGRGEGGIRGRGRGELQNTHSLGNIQAPMEQIGFSRSGTSSEANGAVNY